MIKISELFTIYKPSTLIFSEQEIDENGINFVSSSGNNNGIVNKVKKINGQTIYKSGSLTVPLKGSVLEVFLQTEDFYCAHQIAVLVPRVNLTINERIYYCSIIKANKYRYNYGRQADKTLFDLLIPARDEIPDFVYKGITSDYSKISKCFINKKIELNEIKFKYFEIKNLFNITTDPFISISEAQEIPGKYPFISTGNKNNGAVCFTGIEHGKIYPGGCITIASSGNAGETFYQGIDFKVTNMVTILKPKFTINKYIGIFFITIIRKEKYRYSYGRKFGIDRTRNAKIKLPVDDSGNPDFKFMEEYIKSLPYSLSL